jgi:hypothetical protein
MRINDMVSDLDDEFHGIYQKEIIKLFDQSLLSKILGDHFERIMDHNIELGLVLGQLMDE